jgi:hypothetical protein
MAGLSALRQAAQTKESSPKKSSTPIVEVSQAVGLAMKSFKKARAKMVQAEAEKIEAEAQMIPEADVLRRRICKDHSKLHPSINLKFGDDTLTFTQKSQFKKITQESSDKIRSKVGEANFAKWFKMVTTYTIDENKMTDDIANRLLAALGDDVGILTMETLVVPTESFVSDAMLDEKVYTQAEELREAGLVEPYKPSFK